MSTNFNFGSYRHSSNPTLLETQNKLYLFKFIYSVHFLDRHAQFISPTKCTKSCWLLYFNLICIYLGINWFIPQISLNQIAALVLSNFCLAFLKLLIIVPCGTSIVVKLSIPCTLYTNVLSLFHQSQNVWWNNLSTLNVSCLLQKRLVSQKYWCTTEKTKALKLYIHLKHFR